MKSDELREWVEGPTHAHNHQHSFIRGYRCQDGNHGAGWATVHESAQGAVICNLTEAVRRLMVRVEDLEAPSAEAAEIENNAHVHRSCCRDS